MRYYYESKPSLLDKSIFSTVYHCDHPVYDKGTLYRMGSKGLVVIRQYLIGKQTYWAELDNTLADDIYKNPGFYEYFKKHAEIRKDGLYPTVTVRQIMWALRMKPLKKERWETVFDRREI